MRLGLFGGTFDPVHFGHLLLAECCREQCRLDAVWFLPAAVPPHKQARPLAPAQARIEMLELAIAGNAAFAVSRYETDRGGVNYTAETLAHFHEEDPERELFFLLGADMLHDLPHWREPGRICQLAMLVAVRRAGAPPLDFRRWPGSPPPSGSSRCGRLRSRCPPWASVAPEIRRRLSTGESIRYRTPRAVEAYIESHGLYIEPEALASG